MRQQVVVMVHNLRIVDYGLGHPGSVHDSYAFQSTRVAQEAQELIPEGHWLWADSAYALKTWSLVPFKTARGVPMSRAQKLYNRHLSTVRIFTRKGWQIFTHRDCFRFACASSTHLLR